MKHTELFIPMQALALVASALSSPAFAMTSTECEKKLSMVVSCSYVFDEASSTCSLKCKLAGGGTFPPPRPTPVVIPGTTPAGPGISGHTGDPRTAWVSLSIPEKAELNGFRQFSRELGNNSPAAKIDWGTIAERTELDVYKKLASEGMLGKQRLGAPSSLEKEFRRGPLEANGPGDKAAGKAGK